MPGKKVTSNEVRRFTRTHFVDRARTRGQRRFSINAGEVHKAMRLHNRVPLVCTSLDSIKFLKENGLKLVEKSGPPSGQSTSVTFVYEFEEAKAVPAGADLFMQLRGIAKHIFEELGGGEEVIRRERSALSAGLSDDAGHRP
jgi:hypothetical protein